jgi:hypothetical protein
MAPKTKKYNQAGSVRSEKLLLMVVIVLALFGFGLLTRSLYKIYNRKPLLQVTVEISAELQGVRAEDAKVLEGEIGNDEELAKRLRRFAMQNSDESRRMARKFINHKSPIVSAAAIEAIGGESAPDINVMLKKALSSSDYQIRWAALRSLGQRSDSERVKFVEDFVATVRASGQVLQVEELLALITLFQLRTEEGPRAQILNEILAATPIQNISIFDSSKEQSLELCKTFQRLFNLVPDDSRVEAFAIRVLKKLGENNQTDVDTRNAADLTRVKALQYVGAYNPASLAETLPHLPWSEDYTYQLAVIDFLAAKCPKNRKNIEELLRKRPASSEILQHLDGAQLTIKCGLGL